MTYRKSSHSHANGNCVAVADDWRKSQSSTHNGQCVETASARPGVKVRDTKQQDSAERVVLRFSGVSWSAFIERVKTEF